MDFSSVCYSGKEWERRLLHGLRKVSAVVEDPGSVPAGLPSPAVIPKDWCLVVIHLKDCGVCLWDPMRVGRGVLRADGALGSCWGRVRVVNGEQVNIPGQKGLMQKCPAKHMGGALLGVFQVTWG